MLDLKRDSVKEAVFDLRLTGLCRGFIGLQLRENDILRARARGMV